MGKPEGELLPGTFELLILKALSLGEMHGWGISERIERLSGGVFAVQQGAIYPVLQRMLRRGWITASWHETEHGRRARFYRLTASGRERLEAETSWWRRASGGVDRVLRAATQES
jgi:PadR family transcriptional regulator PadR